MSWAGTSHQQRRKAYRYSGYFICKETRSHLKTLIKCSTFLQVNYIQITTTLNLPLVFKWNQSNLEARIYTTYNYIHWDYDLLSISEQYTTQYLFLTMSQSNEFTTTTDKIFNYLFDKIDEILEKWFQTWREYPKETSNKLLS